MKNSWFEIIKKLFTLIYGEESTLLVTPYKLLIQKLIKYNGIIYTIKYLKQCRLHCTRYLCGQPLMVNDMLIGLDKSGWPKCLSFLKHLTHNTKDNKILLSLLLLSRSFELSKDDWKKIKPNYGTITDPFKKEKMYIIPTGVLYDFVSQHDMFTSIPKFSFSNFYLSLKGGPLGKATISCMLDMCNHTFITMNRLIPLTGGDFGRIFMKTFGNVHMKKSKFDVKHKWLGKISFIKDPEAKLRLIAISDYWTQLVLKPIHSKILDILKNLECDRTFTQNPQNHWDNNDEKFWSLDLSAATDRFPIHLQRRLMSIIFNNKDFGRHWSCLLSEREFKLPEENNSIRYRVGQPMGTYSSWAAFTLTHHLVLYYCARLNNLPQFNQYMILGDDIVIKNDKVAKTYINVMTKLGVDISINKTHVSKDTYEFAKRWIKFVNGKTYELTGLPLRGILHNFNNPNIVFTILYDYFKIKRNFLKSSLPIFRLTKELYTIGYKVKGVKTFNQVIFNNIKDFSTMLDINFGYINYENIRNLYRKIDEFFPNPNDSIILSEIKRVGSYGLVEYFRNFYSNLIKRPNLLLSKFGVSNKVELKENPLYLSITNSIKRNLDNVDNWDKLELIDITKELSELDIDSVFNKQRQKYMSLLALNKVYKSGFKVITDNIKINQESEDFQDLQGKTVMMNQILKMSYTGFVNQITIK